MKVNLPMPPSSDDQRLWLTCAAAAGLHLALLFGVQITSRSPAPSSLEVTLTATADNASSLTARILAPVAQTGSGMRRDLRSQRAAKGGPADISGLRHAADLDMRTAALAAGDMNAVTTHANSEHSASNRPQDDLAGADDVQQLMRQERAGEHSADPARDPQWQVPSDSKLPGDNRLTTRASRQAAYRETWRQHVERAGAANFPWSALTTGQAKSLTLLVVVRADGSVGHARVLRSSGLPMLDRAALDILRLAGPFPAFPESLRQETAELSFSYQWEFFPGNRAALRIGR